MTFYDNLKNACAAAGTTVTALVKSMGMSQGNMAKWKNGGVPKADTLAQLAVRLNVTTDYLVTGQKEQPISVSTDGLSPDVQELIRLCGGNPELTSALLALARQIQTPPAE